jgi:hypothetical protein
MSRRLRIILLILCGVLAVLIAGLIGVFYALRYEPEFYRNALAIPAKEQEEVSDEMIHRMADLASSVRKPGKWQLRFTEQQINGWLAVDFAKHHRNSLPPSMSDPRVEIRPDRIVIACRGDRFNMSTVLTLTVAPSVPEENVLALRIAKARAGLLPLPLAPVLDAISKAAQQSEWRITWRQIGGDPVVLFSIPSPAKAGEPAGKIESVRLNDGEIFISGSNERKK